MSLLKNISWISLERSLPLFYRKGDASLHCQGTSAIAFKQLALLSGLFAVVSFAYGAQKDSLFKKVEQGDQIFRSAPAKYMLPELVIGGREGVRIIDDRTVQWTSGNKYTPGVTELRIGEDGVATWIVDGTYWVYNQGQFGGGAVPLESVAQLFSTFAEVYLDGSVVKNARAMVADGRLYLIGEIPVNRTNFMEQIDKVDGILATSILTGDFFFTSWPLSIDQVDPKSQFMVWHLALLAKMAKVDGRVSQTEIQHLNAILDSWSISEETRENLRRFCAEQGKTAQDISDIAKNVEENASRALKDEQDSTTMRIVALDAMFRMALADDNLDSREVAILRSILPHLKLNSGHLELVAKRLEPEMAAKSIRCPLIPNSSR